MSTSELDQFNAAILILGRDWEGEYLRRVWVAEAHVRVVIIFDRIICANDGSGYFCLLSGSSASDAEPLHLGAQRRPLQPKPDRCAFWSSDDPVRFRQRLDNVLALGVF